MKLGYSAGYWGSGPPAGAAEASRRPSGSATTRSGRPRPTAPTPSRRSPGGARHDPTLQLGTGIVQMSARTPAATAMAAMTLDHLSGGRFDPRPRRVRTAGGRGLVRPAVPEAAGPHARVRRDRPRDRRPAGAGRLPRRALRPAARGRHRARQAAEVHGPPVPPGDPDLPRRRGAEERRPGRRDLRRLAAAVLLAQGRRLLPRAAWPRASPASGDPGKATASRWRPRRSSSPATTSSAAPTRSARSSPSTPAAWAPAAPTSTSRCSPGWATRTWPPRSRSCTWPGKKQEAAAAIPLAMVEDVALVGPAGQDPRRAGALAGHLPHHDAGLRARRGAAVVRRADPRVGPRPSPLARQRPSRPLPSSEAGRPRSTQRDLACPASRAERDDRGPQRPQVWSRRATTASRPATRDPLTSTTTPGPRDHDDRVGHRGDAVQVGPDRDQLDVEPRGLLGDGPCSGPGRRARP